MQKENNTIKKDIQAISKRLERLEKVILSNGSARSQLKKNEDFAGATGGIRFLISEGFLEVKRSLSEIRGALEKNGYNYSIQAAQSALNRLSKAVGPLVSLKESGKKVYVKRK